MKLQKYVVSICRNLTCCKRNGVHSDLAELLNKTDVNEMLWGAFGPGAENYFFSWLDKANKFVYCMSSQTLYNGAS
jgi:hypothetical protein